MFDEINDEGTIGIKFDTYEQKHYVRRMCKTGRWVTAQKLTDKEWQLIKANYKTISEALRQAANGRLNDKLSTRSGSSCRKIQSKK